MQRLSEPLQLHSSAALGVGENQPHTRKAAASAAGHPERHNDGIRDYPVAYACLANFGVEENVRTRGVRETAISERADLQIEDLADPGYHRLGDHDFVSLSRYQVVDLPRRDPLQLGLDDNREQRLVDPVPALQKRREERPRP